MNQSKHSSARLSLGAALIGRRADSSPVSPATLYHVQMYGPSRAGHARGFRSIHAPVRVNSVRGWGELLQRTDPCLGANLGTGLFCLEHGSRRAEITSAQSPIHGFSERNECHSKYPLRASSNHALRIARKRGQGRAKDQQELVNLGQGGGRCD